MAISAVVAVGAIGDELVEKIRERAEKIKIGPGNDPASEMGPLITAVHRDKVAVVRHGRRRPGRRGRPRRHAATRSSGFEDGHWIGLSLLDKVPTTANAYQDEIFGPVLCVLRVDTYEEGVALINASPFGNGTAIFTRDGGAARRFQLEIEAGMVGVNVPIPVPVGYHSFGGWKDSLFGDHHIYGNDGMHFYTRGKVVTTRWPDPADGPVGRRPGLPAQPLKHLCTPVPRLPPEAGHRRTRVRPPTRTSTPPPRTPPSSFPPALRYVARATSLSVSTSTHIPWQPRSRLSSASRPTSARPIPLRRRDSATPNSYSSISAPLSGWMVSMPLTKPTGASSPGS